MVVGSHLRREGAMDVDVGLADLRATQGNLESARPAPIHSHILFKALRHSRKHVQMRVDMLTV